MPSQPHLPRMPRVYLVRHGETEWSLSGQHTGRTDIPLTENGEKVLSKLGKQIVGDGSNTLSRIIKSPRKRAQTTFDLLFSHYQGSRDISSIPSETTESVREWDYGEYEGITSKKIHESSPDWDIFKDGCPGGESLQEMKERVDGVIEEIRKTHQEYWTRVKSGECEAGTQGGDVLVVSHGHFSKCFLARWIETDLSNGKHFIVDAGGVSVGSYDHKDLREPALQ
ncbi:hypothetical protein BT93_L0222 [Corymbia citriodora subsp. variegata]|uniref:Phosphoglycerate mutase n=1 Tax=Corymbia citriodora subsp. variegata TaxID=360336 RepID=A0A8T0CJ86_CORYI|nr:hypothetical protein BT93_L0222 [Corymbia citriodora subsp. variegata]